jgi:hypothetical protein
MGLLGLLRKEVIIDDLVMKFDERVLKGNSFAANPRIAPPQLVILLSIFLLIFNTVIIGAKLWLFLSERKGLFILA